MIPLGLAAYHEPGIAHGHPAFHFWVLIIPQMRSPTILLLAACLAGINASANNIQVTNAALTGDNGTSVKIRFNLAWDNSWRGGSANNWDAAWVFVKWRTNGGLWRHVNPSNTGHTVPTAGLMDLGLLSPAYAYNATTNPVVGIFFRRSANGTGGLSLTGVQLNWNYAQLGITYNDITAVEVFAIEMVHVNQGTFAVGGQTTGGNSSQFAITTINTGDASIPPSGTGSLGGMAGGHPNSSSTPSSSDWPNGYNAFYCMKYEISQQQYVDFLNTLTYEQQAERTTNPPSSAVGIGAMESVNNYGNGIDIMTPGIPGSTPAVYACNQSGNLIFGEVNDAPSLSCNFLNWDDVVAYMDWSGLRPMSDLEFEKACRGPLPPLIDEYAWGTGTIASAPYGFTQPNTDNEAPTGTSATAGNALYASTSTNYGRPTRVGAMAAAAGNSGRISSGASYYGIMDLSGNVSEATVSYSHGGLSYTGAHGDGLLTATGQANATNWPVLSNNSYDYISRGGAYNSSSVSLRIVWRDPNNALSFRLKENGGRGVRTAP